jgi:hypothetical protein
LRADFETARRVASLILSSVTDWLAAAYLDRGHAGWREDAQRYAAAWRVLPRCGKMTDEKADQIAHLLRGWRAADANLNPGLVKKIHPDQGPPPDLAARIDQANDVLRRSHR